MLLASSTKAVLGRFSLLAIAAMFLGGCFTPLYGEKPQASIETSNQLRQIDVPEVGGRHGVVLRNEVVFLLTGGAGQSGGASLYRLSISPSAVATPVFVENNSQRPVVQSLYYSASFALIDIATGKVLFRGNSAAAVSNDRSQQRLAAERALAEAYERAAKTAAEQIVSQVSGWFATRG